MSEQLIDTPIDVYAGLTHFASDGSGVERPYGLEMALSHTDCTRKQHMPTLINGPQIQELCTCQIPQVKQE